MSAYYNEHDPLKAEILREAIKDGAIAPGDVDERSITDVRAGDLAGYIQCHFFAGGGFWSLAARLAGWRDDEPMWTGSCPCPSFSAAGKGQGFDDPRHLWPDWARLIRERRPPVLFGEQADDAVGFGWLDLVQTDLEAQAYAVGKVVFGAHSVGAPHIRQRLYFCADTEHAERRTECETDGDAHRRNGSRRSSDALNGSDAAAARSLPRPHAGMHRGEEGAGSRHGQPERSRDAGEPADADGGISSDGDLQRSGQHGLFAADRGAGSAAQPGGDRGAPGLPEPTSRQERHAGVSFDRGDRGDRGPGWLSRAECEEASGAGATRGFWGDCDWWYGRDGLYRAIGPGLFPLAHGSPARVGRLRLYGDAIVVYQAAAFIEAYREVRGVTV